MIPDAPREFAHVAVPAAKRGAPKEEGRAIGATVTGPGGVNVDLALVRWPDGTREVKTLEVNQSPPQVTYAGGRVPIYLHSTSVGNVEWIFVRALSPNLQGTGQPSAQSVGEDQLDWILGSSFRACVSSHGAVSFGSNAEVRGDTSKTKNLLVVAFELGDHLVPLVAFAITRQLAMFRGFDKAKWDG